jgi:hypothetical protein
MTHLLFAALLSAAYPPAPPPPAEKPLGPPPQILVASVEQGKLLVNRTVYIPKVVERIITVQDGNKTIQQKVAVTEMVPEMRTTTYDLSGVKAFDGAGKEIDAKTLAERLKKATPVVVSSDGQPVDAQFLQLLKTEAVVLVVADMKPGKTGVPLPPDRVPPPPPPPLPPEKPGEIKKNATLTIADEPKKDEPKKEEPKGKEVKFETHPHFEKNTSGLKGDVSFLAITDAKSFTEVFGIGRTMGPKPNYVTDATFDSKVVIATIQRGMKSVTYKVDKVTADDDTLYIAYTTTTKESTSKSNTPLIVSVDKGKYKSVVFLENGKKVGTAEFPK